MPTVKKKLDADQLQAEGPGGLDQPRDQGRQGRQEHVVRGAGGGGRSRRPRSWATAPARRRKFRRRSARESNRPRRTCCKVNLTQTTIPHLVLGRYRLRQGDAEACSGRNGRDRGGAVRAVMTSAGVQNVLTKSIGTTNPHNVIKATFNALKQTEDRREAWRPCAARPSRSCNHGAAFEQSRLQSKRRSACRRRDERAGIHLKWVRSAICAPVKHKLVIKGLGFTRLNQVIERADTPSIRGMVAKVPHLVEIVDSQASQRIEAF